MRAQAAAEIAQQRQEAVAALEQIDQQTALAKLRAEAAEAAARDAEARALAEAELDRQMAAAALRSAGVDVPHARVAGPRALLEDEVGGDWVVPFPDCWPLETFLHLIAGH